MNKLYKFIFKAIKILDSSGFSKIEIRDKNNPDILITLKTEFKPEKTLVVNK